ncbi:MAG: ATP-binding protein, partial [Thermohalobaculum sp.]|nr:ATP-binding protein [Thermohalobaculum sp.]
IKQILLNLLLNAVQATPRGKRVLVRAESGEGPGTAGSAVLLVEDEGPGVAPHLRERVFEPFFTTKDDGTGLGLAISQRIARAHGGSLRVEEAGGGGARFVLTLPSHPGGGQTEGRDGEDPGR